MAMGIVTGSSTYGSNGTLISGGTSQTTGTSSSYLNAIQSLLQQGQAASTKQLKDTQDIQDQLLKTQKEQTQKVQVQEQQASMESQMATRDNYTSLLQQLITLSQRNAVQNQRMFS